MRSSFSIGRLRRRLQKPTPKELVETTANGIWWTMAVFVVLRLFGVIHWSWWWVMSPLPIGLGILFLLASRFKASRYEELMEARDERLRRLTREWWKTRGR